MEFAFGTYSNDALKLANHRAERTGIQHQHAIDPQDPAPGQPVTLHIVTRGDSDVTQAAAIFTLDGSLPQGRRGSATNGTAIPFEQVQVTWDSLLWDYVIHWQAVIPAQAENTLVRYIISGWSEPGPELFAEWPDAYRQVQHTAMIHFGSISADTAFDPGPPDAGHVYSYHVDTVQTPAWAQDAVIYQVFLDRFHPGEGSDWQQTSDLGAVFGGTLWGVRDQLDYLADLGVDALWLSPLWMTPSYHGYDVSDYDRVDPRFGGEEALRAVVEGAHARGMRVLLDMVCNHISDQHPFFVDARSNPGSPYRDWFYFDEVYPNGYRGFFNVAEMPELNFANDAARDWMVENAVRWLRDFDVDGYRLDYAAGPGPDFWTAFHRAVKAEKPDCFIFGEVTEPPSVLRRYTGRLDGCLDFTLNDALRRTFAIDEWHHARFESFVAAQHSYFDGDFLLPVFVDNHDMDRFSHVAGDDNARLQAAVERMFALPQPVVILYGTEVGLHQPKSTSGATLDEGRVPMVWDDRQDADLLAFFKAQIAARKARRASGS